MSAQTSFEVGTLYPMTEAQGLAVLASLGLMARITARGGPDTTRGRRYLGANPDHWEFWLTSGQRVDWLFSPDELLLGSISQTADSNRPPATFEYVPAKCIKPGCDNLVAPVGAAPAAGHFKNYRGTGACQKGHNGYTCSICQRPHSYTSAIGIKHAATDTARI